MENSVQKHLWRRFLDILLIVLLSSIAVTQVAESFYKFIKGQTTETISVRDLDQKVYIHNKNKQ